jgi:broad specificity phosphatase PhoE
MRHFLMILPVALLSTFATSTAFADPTLVILVRHAEKAATPADDPPLTAAGEARARALVAALADTRLNAIFTTQFLRTRNTAALIAQKAGIEPRWFKADDDTPAHVKSVVDAIRSRPPGDAVLVVGHSNTVPAIIGALGGPKMFDLCETEYSNLFILIFAPAAHRLIRSQYGIPDPPAPPDCVRSMRQSGK